MAEKKKTRWSCIIIAAAAVLIVIGLVYLFFTYVLPFTLKMTLEKPSTTLKLDEGAKKLDGLKSYGVPIKDSDPAGRTDPFAPI